MQKIKDYAMIGSGRSAVLVSRNGSIDWLCWPRFDSPSIFANILDEQRGGKWEISPILPAKIKRQYIEGTNVLQTRFLTDSGTFVLTDFMPVFSEEEKQQLLQPEQEIIRRIECEQGEVEIRIFFNPRPNYGKDKPTIQEAGSLGLRIEIGRQLFTLRSEIKLTLKENYALAQTKLKAGQRFDFSLTYSDEGPAVLPPLGNLVSQKLALAIDWWQKWSNRSTYNGPYKAQVARSALALKLLGYAPSGSFIAAPTTSLPISIGGDLNWGDYRFCWLRDAAFTVRALFGLGYTEEAEAFVSWLLHSTRLTSPKLKVLYDVYGGGVGNDVILPHLKGTGSYPVRIGNGVQSFFELDIYGEVIEAVTHFVRAGGTLDHETQKMLLGFGEYICRNWQRPDTGIWEKMFPMRHYTHSKLMCWVALDRLIELQKKGQIKDIPSTFTKEHKLIRKIIEEKGWNRKMQSYTQIFEGEELDSTVLVIPLYEFEEASSARMQQTFQRVQERLSSAPGLIYRYEKSPQEGEGAFGLCSFWNAEFLARGGGSLQDAHQAFNQILFYANDLGLFSEQIDPGTGDALGNFPQAFTHVGLINAALSLAKREEEEH